MADYEEVRAIQHGMSIAFNAFRSELKLSNEDYFRAMAVAEEWFEESTGWSQKEFNKVLQNRVKSKSLTEK